MISSVVSHKRMGKVFQRTMSSLKKRMQNPMTFTTDPYEIFSHIIPIISIYMMNMNLRSIPTFFANFKFIFQANINWSKFFAVLVGTVFSFMFIVTFSRTILTMFARAISKVAFTSKACVKTTLSSSRSSSRRIITFSTAKFFLFSGLLLKYFSAIFAYSFFPSNQFRSDAFLATLNRAISRTISIFVGRFHSFVNFIAPLTRLSNSSFLRIINARFGAIFRVFARDALKLFSTVLTNKNFHLALRS